MDMEDDVMGNPWGVPNVLESDNVWGVPSDEELDGYGSTVQDIENGQFDQDVEIKEDQYDQQYEESEENEVLEDQGLFQQKEEVEYRSTEDIHEAELQDQSIVNEFRTELSDGEVAGTGDEIPEQGEEPAEEAYKDTMKEESEQNINSTVIDQVTKTETDQATKTGPKTEPKTEIEPEIEPDTDTDDGDDFGSFEEQELELPTFHQPLIEVLESIIPTPSTDPTTPELEFKDSLYDKVTSRKRVFKKETVNNYNRMKYWATESATNTELNKIVTHWTSLEQGFTTSTESKPETSYQLFHWSSKSSTEAKLKFENKSHQDVLLKVVLHQIELLQLAAKKKQDEWERQRRVQIEPRLKKHLKESTDTKKQDSDGTVSPTKKKFTIGSLFKFNKKSSISKDHISSDTVNVPVVHSNLAELVERDKQNADRDPTDSEDDEEDDPVQYNNLNEMHDQESIQESEQSLEGLVSSLSPDTLMPSVLSPTIDSQLHSNTDDDFEEFVSSPPPEDTGMTLSNVLSPPPESIVVIPPSFTDIITPTPLNNLVVPLIDNQSNSEDEFDEFIKSPSPMMNQDSTTINQQSTNAQVTESLIDL